MYNVSPVSQMLPIHVPDHIPKYDTFTESSTHGWMMTAHSTAPPRAKDGRHLKTEVSGLIKHAASPAPHH